MFEIDEINDFIWPDSEKPFLLEVSIDEDTYVFPKLEFGKPNQDQTPYLERALFDQIMHLGNE